VQPGSKGKILVVEDNALNQLVAEGVVSRLGYEVHSVPNGADAVAAVQRNDYAAVLMDCHMPVMDGFTATQEIRQRENGRRTPIIAMTAGALSEDRDRCLAAGMDDYISKPVDLARLENTLNRWVSDPEAVAGNGSAATHRAEGAGGDPAGNREPALDGTRLAHLRQLLMPDGSSLLPVVVDTFVKSSADQLGAIRRAVENKDANLLQDAAHALKGASANIGANPVAALCAELELAARSEDRRRAEQTFSSLDEELRRAHAALQGYAGAPG